MKRSGNVFCLTRAKAGRLFLVLLSTALLIGPAAAALRLTNRLGVAIILAVVIGVGATWLGLLLAYDSYDWFPSIGGWPVSFFVIALILVFYIGCQIPFRWRVAGRRHSRMATAT